MWLSLTLPMTDVLPAPDRRPEPTGVLPRQGVEHDTPRPTMASFPPGSTVRRESQSPVLGGLHCPLPGFPPATSLFEDSSI